MTSSGARPHDDLPLRATQEVRLLELQPARADDEPIACNLRVVSLDHPPSYEALSYTWGPAFEGQILDAGSIELGGLAFEVTGNLHAALKRFRPRDGSRLLWVDAVCIDQINDDERSAQVAIMSRIYAAAHRVLVWLGEDSPTRDGSITMAILRHLATQVTDWDIVKAIMASRQAGRTPDVQHYDETVSRLLPADLVVGSIEKSPSDSEHAHVEHAVKAIRTFFTRRYFSRLWVVQEMYHAQNGIIHCGTLNLPWQAFQRGFDRLRKAGTSLLLRGTRQSASLDVLGGTMIERVSQLVSKSEDTRSFLRCIALCHGTHCQDPRDRIFALSSLNAKTWPQPDYKLSASEVSSRFSKSCIEHGYVQTTIMYAARQQADPSSSLARQRMDPAPLSWVPDWGQPISVGTSFNADWISEGSPDLLASVDPQGRLSLNLSILGAVTDDATTTAASRRLQLQPPATASDAHVLLCHDARAWLSAPRFQSGDMLCRMPWSARFEIDPDTNRPAIWPGTGVWIYEDGIIALRPRDETRGEFVLLPSVYGAFGSLQNQLERLPVTNNGEWKRFCIV